MSTSAISAWRGLRATPLARDLVEDRGLLALVLGARGSFGGGELLLGVLLASGLWDEERSQRHRRGRGAGAGAEGHKRAVLDRARECQLSVPFERRLGGRDGREVPVKAGRRRSHLGRSGSDRLYRKGGGLALFATGVIVCYSLRLKHVKRNIAQHAPPCPASGRRGHVLRRRLGRELPSGARGVHNAGNAPKCNGDHVCPGHGLGERSRHRP